MSGKDLPSSNSTPSSESHTSPRLPPKRRQLLAEVETKELKDLLKLLDSMGIDTDNCKTESQLKVALYKNMKKTAHCSPVPVPLVTCAPIFEGFARKQADCGFLLEDVQRFLATSRISSSSLVEKLHLPSVDCLLDGVKKGRYVCSRKPMLLIAGTTSSGKSTLLNALLGETILPTGYNASTSVLCVLKYGDNNCKYAIIHLNQGQHVSCERLDLTVEDDVSKFRSYVSTRKQVPDAAVCTKAEVFWPLDLLKYVNLVDSPGVTEDEASVCAARHMTEQFQQDLACGCIYVIDASRSAEEAGQVGGLLSNSSMHPSLISSALFVVNKWDRLVETLQEGRTQQEYLDILRSRVKSCWGPIQEKQLIPMNAKLALAAQEAGHTTQDMHVLCEGIRNILPKTMDNTFMKALRRPCELMDRIEGMLESALRQLRLPLEEREAKMNDDTRKMLSFQKSMKVGRFAEMKALLEKETETLIELLASYLKSSKSFAVALKWKKSDLSAAQRTFMDDRNVKDMAASRFCEMICHSTPFKDFCQWVAYNVMPGVLHMLKEFTQLKEALAGGHQSSYRTHDEYLSNPDKVSIGAGYAAMAVSALILGMPLAIAVGAVVGPVYALVKMVSSLKDRNFRRAVEEAYRDMVQSSCTNNHGGLRAIVTGLLKMSCKAVSLIQEELPDHVCQLEYEMEAMKDVEKGDMHDYEGALVVCQGIKGRISKFKLEMDIHDYKKDDFEKTRSPSGTAKGTYGVVCQVSVPGKGPAALKTLHEEISERNAEVYIKELSNCRKSRHENVVSFFGSVVVSRKPLRLGLLFEWCGGGTLADEIFNSSNLPAGRQEGFARGQDVMLQTLNGVKYLHSLGVIHRDLKPENIMLTDRKQVKLGDMGLAKTTYQVTGTLCGTSSYIAPEVFLRWPYGPPADMYSIGIIMWEVWQGKKAYSDIQLRSDKEFRDRVVSGDLRPSCYLPGLYRRKAGLHRDFVDMRVVGTNWAQLSERCWKSDYKQRPTAEAAYDAVKNIQVDSTGTNSRKEWSAPESSY